MTTNSKDPIVIVEALRTPIGSFQSTLKSLKATDLGAVVVRGLMHMTDLPKDAVDEVIMGSVLQAGQGQAPARQVVMKAGLSESTSAITLNKVCGSGMKAVMMGASQILAGESSVVIAGGMESMSNAPFFIDRPGRKEAPPADPDYKDHMFHDGLHDAYVKGTSMGIYAEEAVAKYKFTRDQQDAFAVQSVTKAKEAARDRLFEREIVPIVLKMGEEGMDISTDEPIERAKLEKIPQLKPAFKEDGTITAATASAITDGAAGLLLMRASEAKKRGLEPRAKIVSYAAAGLEPKWFTLAPIDAITKVMERAKWSAKDVDLYEINEAFAVVAMAAQKDLGIPDDKLNVHGGACALGHPIGASGARILVTLINALKARKAKRGIASLCIGGGEGVAMAVELVPDSKTHSD